MIKSVLLAVDGSAFTEPVIQYGIEIARKFDAYLRILTVIDIRIFEWAVAIGVEGFAPIIPSSGYQEESQKLLDQKAEEVLKKTEKILNKSNVKFELDKESGNPIDVICDKARLVDLVVMGARGEFAKWSDKMLGATLEATTRLSIKPVFICPKSYRQLKKIMVSYDGSENACKALSVAAHFAAELDLPLMILTVHESSDEAQMILKEATEYLSPHHIPHTETRHAKGEAVEKIVQISQEENIDLIVMGSYGHSRIREAILGSTTVQTMRKVNIPLLLAR
jgi:nucleotide-binding universal stress UspA family protein